MVAQGRLNEWLLWNCMARAAWGMFDPYCRMRKGALTYGYTHGALTNVVVVVATVDIVAYDDDSDDDAPRNIMLTVMMMDIRL